ncbi:serine hydrolase FSH [Apiospora arundinis]|uniref:Serine hydrolase FSH n=1 Tax=Apiospora arundinis TaxID=335852 RepID=A0ABR2HUU1_9PEZI
MNLLFRVSTASTITNLRPATTSSRLFRSFSSGIMSSTAAPPSSSKPAKNTNKPAAKPAPAKRELKILMLHGYTQSGPLFKNKTGALNKLLNKTLSPPPYNYTVSLVYPTGPHNLRPADIPGYQPPEGGDAEVDDGAPSDNWGWFRREDATGKYRGFGEGMHRIAETIREAGGVDGVLGFSQGGAQAALVAAALESERRSLPEALAGEDSWASALRAANGGRALRFCIVYSGFVARDEELQWLNEGGMATPSLHFLGGLDTVVDETRSRGLVEACGPEGQDGGKAKVLVHPGGHYVPVSKEWTMPVVGFLREVLAEEESKEAL